MPRRIPETPTRFDCFPPPGAGTEPDLELALRTGTQPELGPDAPRLSASIRHAGCDILRLTLRDADADRWEIPTHLFDSELLAGEAVG